MEQYYRIALGMCLLIGFLQAHPVTRRSINMNEIEFDDLQKLSCNLTFNYPEGVEKPCHGAALKLFKKEWEQANNSCPCREVEEIFEVLGAVDMQGSDTPTCTFTMKDHENFTVLVKATRDFIQLWNTEGQK